MDRATKEQGTLLDSGLLIIRLITGFLMFYLHGWSKLIAGPERWQKLGIALTDVFGLDFLALPFGFLASFSESIGALCILLGCVTRPAAFLLAGTMVVAAAKHFPDGLQGMEKALLFLSMSFFLFLVGPGKYSIDYFRQRKGR